MYLKFLLFSVIFQKTISEELDNCKDVLAQLLQLPDLKCDAAQLQKSIPKHCKELQERGKNISGFYRIQPEHSTESFMVLCDMKTRGGGWTYFLNRFDGTQDFYLNWSEYKNGFGNLAGEFWLGLDNLFELTGYEANELLVELVDWDLKKAYAHYRAFSIGNENEGYSLKILGEYSGDAGDDLMVSLGNKFSTKDKDQDRSSKNCAILYSGAWWYNRCMACQLTGKYLKTQFSRLGEMAGKMMYWNSFRGFSYSLKQARMMVRPRTLNSLPHDTYFFFWNKPSRIKIGFR